MRLRILTIVLSIALLHGFTLSAQNALNAKKILVVYFSHSGNTKVIAQQIQKATGADIFEIKPINDYPTEYNEVVFQAKKEIKSGYKPALKSKVENLEKYDVIIVGSPNWWATIAPPVATFLSSYNFEGKTIIPFITHEGSELGKADQDIKELCPKSTHLEGLAIRGSSVNSANDKILAWLKKNKLLN